MADLRRLDAAAAAAEGVPGPGVGIEGLLVEGRGVAGLLERAPPDADLKASSGFAFLEAGPSSERAGLPVAAADKKNSGFRE